MPLKKKTLDFNTDIDKDNLGTAIADKWVSWDSLRTKWMSEYRETLQYLFATDTSDIMTQTNDYSNTTHIPKLTQIRDLLCTYYKEALFSLPNYIEWNGSNPTDNTLKKRTAIQKFALDLLNKSNFQKQISLLIEDYVDAGNAFAMPMWEETWKENADGTKTLVYEGIKLDRINPVDIVFDPSATDFMDTPKIIRKVCSLGEIKKAAETDEVMAEAFKRALKNRQNVVSSISNGDDIMNNLAQIAGFGSLTDYYSSDVGELLTFYGTLYDIGSDTLYDRKKITVIDRCIVLKIEDMEDISGYDYILKTGWRDNKDNLWSMSPLANILGMQYRIDFLENKRADIFNYISDPMWKVIGDVTPPEYTRPGAEWNCDTDGNVEMMHPDTTALQADLYIDKYAYQMEEMVGAPREAMGFRTPGEKTAFEYSQMVNAATRVFNRQIRKFELEMFEPIINALLNTYLTKKAGQQVTFKTVDMETDNDIFTTISTDELKGDGSISAVGSLNFADRSNMAQTLQQLGNTALFMNEQVQANISSYVLGKIFCYATGLDRYAGLFKKDVRIHEMVHQTAEMNKGQVVLEEDQQRMATAMRTQADMMDEEASEEGAMEEGTPTDE